MTCGLRYAKSDDMTSLAYIRERTVRDVFDYQHLTACLDGYRKPRDKIRRLLAAGEIVRIRKGLYAFAEPYRRGPLSREWLANLLYGPSYVSLDYALSRHGLIPERVETVTSITTGRSRRFDTPFGRFTYRHMTSRRFATGADLVESDGASFLMASAEKALSDKVWTDRRFKATSRANCKAYLVEDLRIDPARLAAMDRDRLSRIEAVYDSRKVSAFVRCLRSPEVNRHA